MNLEPSQTDKLIDLFTAQLALLERSFDRDPLPSGVKVEFGAPTDLSPLEKTVVEDVIAQSTGDGMPEGVDLSNKVQEHCEVPQAKAPPVEPVKLNG